MRSLSRSYLLGLVALMVAVATTGYFLAGRTLAPSAPSQPTLPRSTVTLSNPAGEYEVPVYKVNNPQQFFLANQRTLRENEGILYLFTQIRDDSWSGQGFKQSVSVAFFSGRRDQARILRIMDIEPCGTPPPGKTCPSYEPSVAYRMALEMPKGWFAENRIAVGDQMRVNEARN
ncbi:MAG: DUF192 domain-containing protein [Meiothermus sp.]|nr:DUF192 domain-containing protein [Meiothermus sp.]